ISIGSATIAVFDRPTAQKLLHRVGKLDLIRVEAKSGVATPKLITEIRPLLPPSAQVRDAAAQVKEDKKGVNGFTSFIQNFLLAFAGIALFVGSFVIANTLSITIAQRMREFATLRTIGATRRQILRSVIVEALVIGIVGSVTGLFLGLGLAKGLNKVFVAAGIDLPTAGTIFAPRAPARLRARLARHADRRCGRRARPRQHDAQSEADGLDGFGADDRSGTRHIRGHPRPGDPVLVRERRERSVQGRLRADVGE